MKDHHKIIAIVCILAIIGMSAVLGITQHTMGKLQKENAELRAVIEQYYKGYPCLVITKELGVGFETYSLLDTCTKKLIRLEGLKTITRKEK